MKSAGSSRKFPASRAEVEAAIARAPGKDRALTRAEQKAWSEAVVVKGGGYRTVREAVAAKRKPGQRGPQVAPTKQLVSVRYSPEVLTYFKASGPGWQSRMNDVLKQWVAKRDKGRVRARET